MKKEKIKKLLMAIGVQRNEAATFTRVYRKIMDAKREDLFPEIVKPVMPVVHTAIDCRVMPIRAEFTATNTEKKLLRNYDKDFSDVVNDRLCKELAEAIYHSGAITLRLEEIYDVGTRYTATVNVAMPWR